MDRCEEGIGPKIHRKENVHIKRESSEEGRQSRRYFVG